MKKHVLIVGSNSPSALSTAKLLIQNGYRISLISRSKIIKSKKILLEEDVKFYQCDISNKLQVKKTFAKLKKVSKYIDSIIFFQRFRGSKMNIENEVKVSISATVQMIELFQKQNLKSHDKSIVVVSSITSEKIALEQPLSYHLAKAALSQAIRYYALKLGSLGIRVNGIEPAVLYKERAKSYYNNNKSLVNLYKRVIPLKRMGSVNDLANLAKFLLSEKSSYITGQIIGVDGGISLHEPASLSRLAAKL